MGTATPPGLSDDELRALQNPEPPASPTESHHSWVEQWQPRQRHGGGCRDCCPEMRERLEGMEQVMSEMRDEMRAAELRHRAMLQQVLARLPGPSSSTPSRAPTPSTSSILDPDLQLPPPAANSTAIDELLADDSDELGGPPPAVPPPLPPCPENPVDNTRLRLSLEDHEVSQLASQGLSTTNFATQCMYRMFRKDERIRVCNFDGKNGRPSISPSKRRFSKIMEYVQRYYSCSEGVEKVTSNVRKALDSANRTLRKKSTQ